MNRSKEFSIPARENAPQMFNRIAGRYDFLNHFLSGNQDKRWRAKLASMLPAQGNLSVLDIATGTGDQLLSLYDTGKVTKGVGIDPAEQMLEIGVEKIRNRGLTDTLSMQIGAAESLLFANDAFDVVTITFGIRNVVDVAKSLSEMRRVLRPGGKILILEFSLPANAIIRYGYLFYFRHVLPRLGGIISGDQHAYRYLNRTVETFPYGKEFEGLLSNAGFGSVSHTPLTFGIASIYSGIK